MRPSRRDALKRRVVIAGVKAGFRFRRLRTATHDPPCTAVTRPGRLDGVLVIEAAGPGRQGTFAIAEHRAVLSVGKRPAAQNQAVGGLRLHRQLRQRDRGRDRLLGLNRTGYQNCRRDGEKAPCLAQSLPPRWPTGERHGKSLKSERAMVPNRAGNLKPLPQFGAHRWSIMRAHTYAANLILKGATYRSLSARIHALRRHRSVTNPSGFPGHCCGAWPAQRAAFASATVSAVMLTMRRTVADGVRMCTGCAAPSSTGPIAMPPPAAVFSRL
jgi:hypothetical protein